MKIIKFKDKKHYISKTKTLLRPPPLLAGCEISENNSSTPRP